MQGWRMICMGMFRFERCCMDLENLTPQPSSLLALGESKPLSLQERGLERGFYWLRNGSDESGSSNPPTPFPASVGGVI